MERLTYTVFSQLLVSSIFKSKINKIALHDALSMNKLL